MTKEAIYRFICSHKLAVIATNSASGQPEAAVVGIAVTPALEIVFDTINTSRKYQNIKQNPYVALVIGWHNETTVQYEGEAVEISGADDDIYRETYYSVYPDGRQHTASWPGLVHFKVVPKWLRYSNFNQPAVVEEMNF